MEGRDRIYMIHAHRHDPVRATSSRDPCLDHPALRGKTATTQPAVITPPAVPAADFLLPSLYTGTIRVESHLGATIDALLGQKRIILVSRKHRDWARWPWCAGHNRTPSRAWRKPIAGPLFFMRMMLGTGVNGLARRAGVDVNLDGPPTQVLEERLAASSFR